MHPGRIVSIITAAFSISMASQWCSIPNSGMKAARCGTAPSLINPAGKRHLSAASASITRPLAASCVKRTAIFHGMNNQCPGAPMHRLRLPSLLHSSLQHRLAAAVCSGLTLATYHNHTMLMSGNMTIQPLFLIFVASNICHYQYPLLFLYSPRS